VKRILSVFVAGFIICTLSAYSNESEGQKIMQINVKANDNITVFELNDSPDTMVTFHLESISAK
jgi:hypothetical protein